MNINSYIGTRKYEWFRVDDGHSVTDGLNSTAFILLIIYDDLGEIEDAYQMPFYDLN